jgi:hypothetical protein
MPPVPLKGELRSGKSLYVVSSFLVVDVCVTNYIATISLCCVAHFIFRLYNCHFLKSASFIGVHRNSPLGDGV